MAWPSALPKARAAVWRAYAAAALVAFCWSGNWIVGRGLYQDMSPVALAYWRWIVAGALFLPFAMPALWRERETLRAEWRQMLVLAAIAVVVFNALVYWGLKTTSAINGSLFNSAQPVIVIVIGWFWFAQKSNAREMLGVLVSMAGVATIVTRGDHTVLLTLQFGAGDLIIIAAMVVWALYSVLLKAWPTHLSNRAFMGGIIVIGVTMMAPVYAVDVAVNGLTDVNVNVIIGVTWLAVVGSLLAYSLWSYAVREAGAARATLFMHLVPVFTALQAVVLLGERVHPFHLAGIGLILAGIYLATAERSGAGRR